MTVNDNADVVRIFVVRHGQTEYNITKRLQGHIDIDLNETGFRQAELCGNRFADIPLDYLISSDLCRCQNTSRSILKHHDHLPLVTSPSLRERMMGPVEGMYLKDALAKYGADFKSMGETKHELVTRLYHKWDEIIDLSVEKDYKNVLICTHGGVITNFINHLYSDLGYSLSNSITAESLRVPYNTSVTVVDIDKQNKSHGIIQMFGDTAHLGEQLKVKEQLLR